MDRGKENPTHCHVVYTGLKGRILRGSIVLQSNSGKGSMISDFPPSLERGWWNQLN